MDAVKVLLDTDIDDAICLSYLLCQPRCELVGVTTVLGRPQLRASLVDAVCRAAGRTDIPIQVSVELTSRRYRGATSFDPDPDISAPHEVAADVDPDGFFAELLGRVE